MTKNRSIRDIKNDIRKITQSATDPRMDGFNTWGHKQDLYEILWFVEDQLKRCSTYAGEEEFLEKREKEKTWKALNK